MFKVRLITITLILSMGYAPCGAEPLAQAYRVTQKRLALPEKGAVCQARSAGFKEDFGDMLGSVKGGLKESFSGRGLVCWGVAASLVLATYGQDKRIQTVFERNHPLRRISRVGDISGTIMNSGFPGAGLYFAGRLSENGELAELGKFMFATTMIKWWLSLGLICTVRRERPETRNLSLFEGGMASFPSGHVAGSFATATVLNEFYGPQIGVPTYLFAGFVGLSRLEDNKHYASDVVAGALLGTITAVAVSRATRTRWARTSTIAAGNRMSVHPIITAENEPGLALTCQF